jgi:hypothetical protein
MRVTTIGRTPAHIHVRLPRWWRGRAGGVRKGNAATTGQQSSRDACDDHRFHLHDAILFVSAVFVKLKR